MTSQTATRIQHDEAISLEYELTLIVHERTGMNKEFASKLAEAIVGGMSARWGGERVYVPVVRKGDRNSAICEAFNGQNASEVCKKFGISRSALYKIVAAAPRAKSSSG